MNADDTWGSINVHHFQGVSGSQLSSDKENCVPKKSNPLDDYNQWFRECKKKNEVLIKRTENTGICQNCQNQTIKSRKENQVEIKRQKQQFETQIHDLHEHYEKALLEQKEFYEQQLREREEELETFHQLLNQPQPQHSNDFDEMLNNLRVQFEDELKNEREVFQMQLEKYITEKIQLETKLQYNLFKDIQRIRSQEVESLLEQIQTLKQPKQPEQTRTISSNFASMLFRDTNRKRTHNVFTVDLEKMPFENDMSIVEDDQAFQGIAKNIRNFNENVRLIDKSCDHFV